MTTRRGAQNARHLPRYYVLVPKKHGFVRVVNLLCHGRTFVTTGGVLTCGELSLPLSAQDRHVVQLLIEHAPYSEFLEHPFCSEGKSWPARHRGDIHRSRYSKQAGVGAALNGYGCSLCCAPGLQAASFQGGKVWSGDAPFAALPSAAWEQALLKVTSVLDASSASLDSCKVPIVGLVWNKSCACSHLFLRQHLTFRTWSYERN